MRGRKPKPTALKILTGNPGRRKLNTSEPAISADAIVDEPPVELTGDTVACGEWRRLSPMLRESRTVTDADRGSLVALCQQWSRYVEANGAVKTAGMVVRSPSGYPMPNPYIAIANKALGNCVKLWVELGMTPSARSRVAAADAPKGSASPLSRFLRRA